MEILLIRHGLPLRIESDQPVDPPLAPLGNSQADALARWLTNEPPDHIVASTMQRAVDTARHLVNAFQLELHLDSDFCEFDRGASAYIPMEELDRNHPHYKKLVDDWVGPAGEQRRRDFQHRVLGALERHVHNVQAKRLAVVCHGGVINAILAATLGIDRMLFFEPAYTSVSRLHWNTKRFQLGSINEAAHLRDVDKS